MSIDLSVHLKHDVRVDALKESIMDVLRYITGLHTVPQVTIRESRREIVNIPSDTKIGQEKRFYLLGFEGREDQVAITTVESERSTHEMATTFSVGATRDDTEYVLGLAGAVGLAKITDSDVEEGFSFWIGGGTAAPQALIERLRLRDPAASFEEACKTVLSNAGQAD